MPPNWYRDPLGLPCLRYWDGRNWTDHTAPMPPPQVDYSGTNTSLWVTLVVLLIVVVIGYVSFHAYAYHRCIITPGILDWPDKCF